MASRVFSEVAITQITSASISLIASSAIAVMIANSRTGKATSKSSSPPGTLTIKTSPYHRIILGLSISDICLSFATLTGPFMAPVEVKQAAWGIGNDASCQANGFLFSFGSGCTPMYTLSLCLYCLFKIRNNMTDETFSRKIEWKMHAISILFNLGVCIGALATKVMNSGTHGTFCTFAAVPTGCRQDDTLECDEKISNYVRIFSLISQFAMPFLCLMGIIISMSMICWHVLITRHRIFSGSSGHLRSASDERTVSAGTKPSPTKEEKENCSNSGPPAIEGREEGIHSDDSTTTRERWEEEIDEATAAQESIQNFTQTANNQGMDQTLHGIDIEAKDSPETKRQQAQELVKVYRREFAIQACLYVIAFLFTYVFPWLSLFTLIINNTHPADFVLILTAIFFPLGGFFNILVYTRPKVASIRRKDSSLSWLRAFTKILKAGGGVPTNPTQQEDPAPIEIEVSKVPTETDEQRLRRERLLRQLTTVNTPSVKLSHAMSSSGIDFENAPPPSRPGNRLFYQWPAESPVGQNRTAGSTGIRSSKSSKRSTLGSGAVMRTSCLDSIIEGSLEDSHKTHDSEVWVNSLQECPELGGNSDYEGQMKNISGLKSLAETGLSYDPSSIDPVELDRDISYETTISR